MVFVMVLQDHDQANDQKHDEDQDYVFAQDHDHDWDHDLDWEGTKGQSEVWQQGSFDLSQCFYQTKVYLGSDLWVQ